MDNETKLKVEESIVEMLKTVYDPEIPVNVYDLGRNPFSVSRLLFRSSSFYWFLTFMCHNYLSSLPVLYPTLFLNIFFHYTPIFFHVYEESMKLSLTNCSIILKLHQAPS